MKRLAIICLLAIAPTHAMAERAITCVAYSAVQPDMLIETVDFVQDASGLVTMVRISTFTGPFFATNDPNATPPTDRQYAKRAVLLSDTTDNVREGDRFTTFTIVEQAETVVYIPTTFLIDWKEPALRRTYFDYAPDPVSGEYGPNWMILDSYECEGFIS